MIHDKKDISTAISHNFEAFALLIESMDKNRFEDMPGGKWSAGQQLDHLVRSVRPLNIAFSLPAFFFSLLYGKANRQPLGYDALKEEYYSRLSARGKASSRYIPPVIPFEQKVNKIGKYRLEKIKLLKRLDAMNDSTLDRILLPHPLIGKITAREMMFFTIFHTEHHFQSIQNR